MKADRLQQCFEQVNRVYRGARIKQGSKCKLGVPYIVVVDLPGGSQLYLGDQPSYSIPEAWERAVAALQSTRPENGLS